MPVTAAVLRELLRTGMTAEDMVEATERIERDEGATKPLSAGAERTRRWRESVTKRHGDVTVTSQASQSVTKRHKASQNVTKRHGDVTGDAASHAEPQDSTTYSSLQQKEDLQKKTPSGAKEKGSVTGERASLPTGWQTVRPQKPRGLASRNPPMRPIGFATIGAAYPAATVAKSIGWRHGAIGAGRRPRSDRVVLEANLTDLAASQPCGLRF